MIEIIIKKYLDENFDIPAFLEYPKEEPNEFILFEKTGSSKENKLLSSTIAFQSYADSMYKASLLNEYLKDVIEGLIKLPEISKVSLNSDYNFTDERKKKYRYQAVFDIYHY